jgi:hypothetical protein
MNTITLKKISFEDLLTLQKGVMQFVDKKTKQLPVTIEDYAFFDNLLSADIASYLFFRFRIKVENESKYVANLKLKIHEAIILMQCCNDYKSEREDENFTSKKYLNELHKQLINLL